jgi:predicted dehydrogenase
MGRRMNRRDFVAAATATGAGFWLAGGVSAAQQRPGPNDRLNVAVIGAGGQGGGNLGQVARTENIVALCDVDERRAAGAFKAHPRATIYHDFRVMLEKQKDIQAVVVSTPDHVHAPASIMAMRMGKHCYCEKPLTHSVWEARQMREVAAKHKVATQMGNQGTANDGFRRGVEVIRAGTLGDVREIHVWTNRPIWPQNIARPAETQEVPKGLHWDLWLGPAPYRPYHQAYVPFAWRGWWDFGTGALGDMACHTVNLAYMSLLHGRMPTSVSAELDPKGSTHMNETAPLGVTVTYEFPARGKLPACRMMWYEHEHRRRVPAELLHGRKPGASGLLIVGARGSLYTTSDYGDGWVLLPQKNFEGFQPPKPTLPRAQPGPARDPKAPDKDRQSAHHAEWLRACKGGPPAMSNFDYAGAFTEVVLLGNVAMRAGKRVAWDSEKLRAVGLPEADRYIRREYRKGWELEG